MLSDLTAQFPALQQKVRGDHALVYLDSAATSLKPQSVIDSVVSVYARDAANIHRAVHELSERATKRYEQSRDIVQRHINARSSKEVIFVRGTTEAINLVAQSYARPRLKANDEILITELEHHSNIVPWQLVCEQTKAKLRVVPVDDQGEVQVIDVLRLLSERTRIVAVSHVSNALGTVLPITEICQAAHEVGAVVLVDGAQAIPHLAVDVQSLDCDFYAFSGHKMYGPTGIGILYGKQALLEAMPPYQGGGDMIKNVTFAHTDYADLPAKFEAGTPDIAGAIGLGAAVEFLDALGMPKIEAHEQELLRYAHKELQQVPGLTIIGQAARKIGVVSFIMQGVHPHDIGTIVDAEGVAIRTGHHCAQPLMERFGVPATARASFGIYNTTRDVDALVTALHKVRKIFS